MAFEPSPGRVPQERPGPAGGKRARNREVRTRGLCEAAIALFLERGLESVTIDEITGRAEVAKGTFYRYFDDKEAVVRAILAPTELRFDEAFERCKVALEAARSQAQLVEAYKALGLALTSAMMEAPSVAQVYLQEARGPATGARRPLRAFADRIAERAVELTHAARSQGMLRELDPQLSALAVIGATERITFAILSGDLPLESMARGDELIDLVLDGVRAR